MTTKKQRQADAERTRELWRMYCSLERRNCSFQHYIILYRSCDGREAARHVDVFKAEHGGTFPPGAPPEA
jgi:hypothetical protein